MGYENRCFHLELSFLTWDEAESNCINLGSNLVSITDRFEQYWLNIQFHSDYSANKWIGLKIPQNNYEWTNGDIFSFSNWDRNKPDVNAGRCISMSSSGFWSNFDCNIKLPSICSIKNSLYTTPTTPTTPEPIKCPNSWTESDNKCHKLFGPKNLDEKKNWFDAESYCKSLNGHLSSFSSLTSVNKVINGQFAYGYGIDYAFWIGLNKLDKNSGYQWSDGSGTGYFNWDFGQPDDVNDIENCVELRTSGRWRDNFCYTNKGWSCQIEKGIDPTNTTEIGSDAFPSKKKI